MTNGPRPCVVCKKPAEFVCMLCDSTSFYCRDHRCIHFASDIAKEYKKANSAPPDDAANIGKLVLGALAVIGFFAAFSWIADAGGMAAETWFRIFVVFGAFIMLIAVFHRPHVTKNQHEPRKAVSPTEVRMRTSTAGQSAVAPSTNSSATPYIPLRTDKGKRAGEGDAFEDSIPDFKAGMQLDEIALLTRQAIQRSSGPFNEEWLIPRFQKLRELFSDPITQEEYEMLDCFLGLGNCGDWAGWGRGLDHVIALKEEEQNPDGGQLRLRL